MRTLPPANRNCRLAASGRQSSLGPSGMEVGRELLLTLKQEPVQVFDQAAFQWILPRKNPGFEELLDRLGRLSAQVSSWGRQP